MQQVIIWSFSDILCGISKKGCYNLFVFIFIFYMKEGNHNFIISLKPKYIHGQLPFKFTYMLWESDYKESWALKNWYFWTVVLEKTPESPLGCKDIQTVHPKGDQSCVFIGKTDVEAETTILWPPDVKSCLIWKDTDAGKDWGQEEKGRTEDEMVGWHHPLDGHGFG